MNPIDLEQIVDAELKRLPGPKAPPTLLPRVLAATAAHPQTAPAGGWFAWPRAGQFAAGLAAALVLIGTWRLMAFAGPLIQQLLPAAGLDRAAAFTRNADDTATVVRVFWEVLLQPVATYLSILVVSFTLACALLWTAVERLAPGGAAQR